MKRNFKLLYVSYARSGRGDEVHTRQFMAAIQRHHRRVVFHTPRLAENVFAMEKRRTDGKGDGADPLREVRYLSAVTVKRLGEQWAVLRREKPDVVVMRACRYLSMVWLCRLLRIPIVLEVNAPMRERFLLAPGEQLRPMSLWCRLEALVFSTANHLDVVSRPLKRYYMDYGIDADRISVVPNGVDVATFHPGRDGSSVRTRHNLGDRIVIGFQGSFVPWHGFEFLIQSLDALLKTNPGLRDKIALLMVGQKKDTFRLPDIEGLSITMTGKVPFEQVPDYLAAMDIITAPYPFIELFYFSPLKVLEGMAMAKPVIASDQGQISELISHSVNGILYTAGDQNTFISRLKRLIQDGEMRSTLGANARHTIETDFTWDINAKRVLEICDQLIKQ